MIQPVIPPLVLKGEITPPPDKSISQRAAIFSLLYEGESEIENYSPAQDPLSSLRCVQQLGAEVRSEGNRLWITGTGRNSLKKPSGDIDCGNSGTAMRLLAGVLTGAGISAKLVGDTSLSSRTMKRIISPLEQMGAHILARNGIYAPLFINRHDPFTAIDYVLPIPSAQLKSCILLAGLFGEDITSVTESIQSRDHTERLLDLNVREVDGKKIISSSLEDKIPNQSYTIPGDFSAAAFWLVAGSIHHNAELILKNTGLNPTRNALMTVLNSMGADIDIENKRQEGEEPIGDIIIKSSSLRSIEIDPSIIPNCIDELPVIAVAMLFAEGTSVIRGAEELRHKETDRIRAMADMLSVVGVDFEETYDGLIIHGNPDFSFDSANFNSYHDHRIAMAAAVLSLKGKNESRIIDAECAGVSYPGFWEDLNSISK